MITAHMVVKNEDRFIWYAISSILPWVEKVLIYDTGSTDKTVSIINSFQSKKIDFKQFKISDVSEIAKIRNMQIKETATDWFWIVDGDEIYPNALCEEITNIIKVKGEQLEGVIVGRYDLLGDIYHYQDESVGSYNLLGRKGHLVLRLINKKNISGLHVAGDYPYEEYFDQDEKDIIYHATDKFRFTKNKLFHAMYLQRSTLGANLTNTIHRRKWKVELGIPLSSDILIPEVFKYPHTDSVKDALKKRSLAYELLASLLTPVKMCKRKIWKFLFLQP